MQRNEPSRTALRVALRRAAHQLYDEPPLVFADPFALSILGPHAAEVQRTPGRNPAYKPRPHSAGLRAFLVARSRYAEDLLARAAGRGVTQYVLLGAGLDTFALRNPYPSLRVFEVDHPATQEWKQGLMRVAGITMPDALTFVPVNFEEELLFAGLCAAGFQPDTPSFFAWLGVVTYLSREAFRATLRMIESRAPGSGFVFDYTQPSAVLPAPEQLEQDSLASRVRLAGEDFRLYWTPQEIAQELATFRGVEDLGKAEINSRYFSNRADNLRVHSSAGRLVSGWL